MTRTDILGRTENGIPDFENKTAVKVITPSGVQVIDYGRFDKCKNKFAAHLVYNKDIGKMDEVGVLGSPSISWVPALFGTIKAGAVPVPMDPGLTKEENTELINKHDFKSIIVTDDLKEKLPDIPTIELNKANEKLPVSNSQIRTVNQNYYENIDPMELGVLMPTSGTTGLPKLSELPHKNFDFVINRTSDRMNVTSNDVLSSIAPWHHIMGFTTTLLLSLYNKSTLVYVFPSTKLLKRLPEFLKENKISIFLGVPKLLNQLYYRMKEQIEEKWLTKKLEHSKLGRKILARQIKKKLGATSLRFLASGGAPLLPEVAEFFEEVAEMPCVEGYGLTETTSLASLIEPHLTKAGYVGKPMTDTDIKIVDPNTLEPKQRGKEGEVLIAGDHLMTGYHNNPTETEEVLIDFEGTTYLKTGDRGILLENNYLKIKGREKNIIVRSSGKNISPEQVERTIGHSPLIEEVMVKEGERNDSKTIEAFVYPNFKELQQIGTINSKWGNLSQKELNSIREVIWQVVSKNNKELAPFKRIKSKKDLYIQEEEFEKTSTEKIKRHKHQTET